MLRFIILTIFASITILFDFFLVFHNKILNLKKYMLLNDDSEKILSQRFKIKRLLGKGSFGNVYECQQKKTNLTYAIKMISKINTKKSRVQCLREQAALLQSLNHPNIVKVYQFFQDEKIVFIKMQYVKYGTLGQLMNERSSTGISFTDEQAAQIMKGIFNAVNYIHSLSILHRDIKPQNILIHDTQHLDKLKIADFGLGAKLEFRSPTAISKCGTYLFMAPEIIWNYTYTKAVDVWSCSIIMYMLKNGSHPFYQPGMTNEQFKQKIKNVQFPLLEFNPQNKDKIKKKETQSIVLTKKKSLLCQDLLNRISKISPNERYTAQDVIKHPWITRNFQDQIPLSLHDSFQGFQISHEISLMMKMFLTLKKINYKPDFYEKLRKNEIFERYSRHCEQVNRKDRNVSPLKVRRLSSITNTRQTSELCQLSQLVMSPKKASKQEKIANLEVNDLANPTIMKLNMIFNNLFDKKKKKVSKYVCNQNEKDYLTERKVQCKEVPDISSYKANIQRELQNLVEQRKKRKRHRILPLRKKNQYGELVGRSCEVKRSMSANYQKKDDFEITLDQISITNSNVSKRSLSTNSANSNINGKLRFRRMISNNSALKNFIKNNG